MRSTDAMERSQGFASPQVAARAAHGWVLIAMNINPRQLRTWAILAGACALLALGCDANSKPRPPAASINGGQPPDEAHANPSLPSQDRKQDEIIDGLPPASFRISRSNAPAPEPIALDATEPDRADPQSATSEPEPAEADSADARASAVRDEKSAESSERQSSAVELSEEKASDEKTTSAGAEEVQI